jgi:AcrR family transcriptional regulator
MPSKQRRDNEKAIMRERVTASAMHLLEAEGAAGVTMRRVAEAMDYTAPVIYQHFENKDALIGELVRQGYDELLTRLQSAQHETDIDTRMGAVAAAYLRFAGDNEHLFEAMNSTTLDADVRRAAAGPVIGVLIDLVNAWTQRHQVELDTYQACEIIWGTLYGIAALGRLDTVGQTHSTELGVHALELLLQGWNSTKRTYDAEQANTSPVEM